MSDVPCSLDEFFTKKIAEDLGIQPEQVTVLFIREMRKRMYRDPQFRLILDEEHLHDLGMVSSVSGLRLLGWKEKCRDWAQEVLAQGLTPCGCEEETQPT